MTRLREKIAQLRRGKPCYPGWAVVVKFNKRPVEIASEYVA